MFSSPSRGSLRRKGGSIAPSSHRSGTPVARSSTPALGRQSLRQREGAVLPNGDRGNTTLQSEKLQQKAKSDLYEGAILSRDDLHAVTAYCRLPLEVYAAMQSLGPYDPCFSKLDAQTGYAFLTLPDKCFIWSFASRGYESPPCYTFSVPKASTSSSSIVSPSLPFCSLLRRGNNREPGMILVSVSGEFLFCENVVSALGSDRMMKQRLSLGSDEVVSAFHRCASTLFIIATSQARLFSIRFVASGGSLQAHAAPFAQSRGLLGRFFAAPPQLGSSNSIVSMASCLCGDDSGSMDVYALGRSGLQKWSVVEGGGERVLADEDIRPILMTKIEGNVLDTPDAISLLDVSCSSDGSAAILFSFAASTEAVQRYQVAFLSATPSTSSFSVSSTSALTYTRYPDTRPHQSARLLIPYGGSVMFVVFSEAVIVKLSYGSNLEERIEMRDVYNNHIVGFGAEDSDVEAPEGLSNLSIVTALSGALLVEIDVRRAQELDYQLSSGLDHTEVLTQRIKEKIQRGVFHSDEIENPISFDLPQEIHGDFMAAVEQLSDEIVHSRSLGLSNSVDLRVQLADRLEKLHRLASFIASNGKMSLLSHNTLRKLSADAELVASAVDVWDFYSSSLAHGNRQDGQADPLSTSVQAVVGGIPDANWEGDLVRFFFRQQLHLLNDVLAGMHATLGRQSGLSAQPSVLIRVNQIFLSIFQAAQRYREETAELYRLHPAHISFEAWTYKLSNIQSLQRQFQISLHHLQLLKRHPESVNEEVELARGGDSQEQILRGQLCDLAAFCLNLYEDRLRYLQVAGGANPVLDKEARLLEEDYKAARSETILCLADVGRTDRAFHLAEQHRDFRVLTVLCFTPKGTTHHARIRKYLNRYGELFAFELYEYYVDEGDVAKLLEEEEEYHALLNAFLNSKRELNRIAWLHDLNLKKWSESSMRLDEEAEKETMHAESKKLMLSLRKLTYVAQLQEEDVASAAGQEKIELIDDRLDILNVHNKIREELQAYTAQRKGYELADALEALTEVLGMTSPAFKKLYCSLALRVTEHRVLSCEDLIDLLTLVDEERADVNIEHFKTAIEVFVRASDITPARVPQALASLWRRIILYDDWLEVTDTALASTSDDALVVKMKRTALYQVLQSASENTSTAEVILLPSECLTPMTLESLQARFRGDESQVSAEDLMEDYEEEVRRAEQVIQIGLERGWFDDITRLLNEARQEVSMDDAGDDSNSMMREEGDGPC